MIQLKNGKLTAHVMPLGASLTGLWHKDWPKSLVLGASDPLPYRGSLAYCGAIVGPVANRISAAAVNIDGHEWRMTPNEGTTCLHSGPDGLHAKNWDVVDTSDTTVSFQIVLPHGSCGLPGKRVISAKYTLKDNDTLCLEIQAQSDRNTLINLAHHPYWQLDDAMVVANHRLTVAADRYLPTTAETLPEGVIASVENTPYDFRSAALIPTTQPLDANLCLADQRRTDPVLAATLEGASGLKLEIETTEPGLQLYNGAGLLGDVPTLHDGQILQPYCGVALEPQAWPDAPNHAHFPSIELLSGTIYHQVTVYRIH